MVNFGRAFISFNGQFYSSSNTPCVLSFGGGQLDQFSGYHGVGLRARWDVAKAFF